MVPAMTRRLSLSPSVAAIVTVSSPPAGERRRQAAGPQRPPSISSKERLMRQRVFVRLLVVACLVASSISNVAAQGSGTRPSVVLILMDDIGYGDIGSYGVKDARTPNLDRLAREG